MNEAAIVVAVPVLTFCTWGLPSVVHIFQMSDYHSHCLQKVLRSGTAKLGEGCSLQNQPHCWYQLQVWESPRPPLASTIHWKPTELIGSRYAHGCVLL